MKLINRHIFFQSSVIFLISLLYYSVLAPVFFNSFQHVFYKYPSIALQLIENNGYYRLTDVSPFYLYLHYLAHLHLKSPLSFIYGLQIITAALSAAMLYGILKRQFSFYLSAFGSIVFILNKSIVLYTFSLEPEIFLTFFILCFVLVMSRSFKYQLILSGIFLALSLTVRPSYLLLVPITAVYIVKKDGFVLGLRNVLIFCLPVIAALGILFFLNKNISEEHSILPMNPGTVFYEGNNPLSTGESGNYPYIVHELSLAQTNEYDYQHVAYRHVVRQLRREILSQQEINHFWSRKALNFMEDYPSITIKKTLFKLYMIFHSYRRHDLSNIVWNDQNIFIKFPSLPFGVVTAFAFFGFLFSRKKLINAYLINSVLFVQGLTMLIFTVSDRQRVSLVPFFIILFVFAIHLLKNKKISRFVLIPIIILILFLTYQPSVIRDEQFVWKSNYRSLDYLSKAMILREQGRFDEAAQAEAKSIALSPYMLNRRKLAGVTFKSISVERKSLEIAGTNHQESDSEKFNMAYLLYLNEEYDKSEKLYLELLDTGVKFQRSFLTSSLPEYYLALIQIKRGKFDVAKEFLERGLQKNPGEPWILAQLFALTNRQSYRNQIYRYFNEVDADYFIGKAFLMVGQYKEAKILFEQVARQLPEFRNVWIYLGISHGKLQNYEKFMICYMKAIQLNEDYIIEQRLTRQILEKIQIENINDEHFREYYSVIQKYAD